METRWSRGRLTGGDAGLALLPLLIMVVAHWGTGPQMTAGDYAQYVMHARALLDGTSYTDLGILRSPLDPFMGPRAFPPGTPLTIAPVVAITGSALGPLSALMSILLGLALWVTARRLAWEAGAGPAVLASGYAGVSLVLGYAVAAPISEPGFLAATWGLVLVLDAPGRWSTLRIVAVVALGLAAISYRVIGVVVVPVVLLRALLASDRAERAALLRVVALWTAILFLGAVTLWDTVRPAITVPFHGPALLTRAVRHTLHYAQLTQEAFLYPLPPGVAVDILHVVMSGLTVIGAVGLLRRSWRSALVLFNGMYAVALLVAPVKEPRYAWPLYPLLVLLMITGLVRVLEHVASPERARRAAAILASLVLVGGVARGVTVRFPVGLQRAPAVRELFAYVSTLGRDSSRVAFHAPRVLTMETGVPAMPLGDRPPDVILAEFTRLRITHVVFGQPPGDSTVTRRVRDAIAADPAAFQELHRNAWYTVYRFRGSTVGASPGA